jgi:hypothetical protein
LEVVELCGPVVVIGLIGLIGLIGSISRLQEFFELQDPLKILMPQQ